MAETKDPVVCFNECKDAVTAIPKSNFAVLNMPLDEAMQESKRVAALATRYVTQLSNTDCNPIYLSSMEIRAAAFAYTVGLMDSYVSKDVSNNDQYSELRKEGVALRQKLHAQLDYIFRNSPELLKALASLRSGRSDFDLYRDLNSIWQIVLNNKERLTEAKFDLALAERAKSIYTQISVLSAIIDIDPKVIDESKYLCMQAWTYAYEAMSEIYLAGRYAFIDQPEIEELFYIDFLQKKSRTKTAETVAPATPAA